MESLGLTLTNLDLLTSCSMSLSPSAVFKTTVVWSVGLGKCISTLEGTWGSWYFSAWANSPRSRQGWSGNLITLSYFWVWGENRSPLLFFGNSSSGWCGHSTLGKTSSQFGCPLLVLTHLFLSCSLSRAFPPYLPLCCYFLLSHSRNYKSSRDSLGTHLRLQGLLLVSPDASSERPLTQWLTGLCTWDSLSVKMFCGSWVFYFLRKHYAKSFKGILKKSHFYWLFQTTICGYFVYFVSTKICIILVATGTEAMAVLWVLPQRKCHTLVSPCG